jgi:tRNA-dihydrouridine synthase
MEMSNFWARLPQPLIGLAPMDGVSDAAFRRVVAMQGVPDVTFTEFTSVGDICRGPEFLLSSLLYHQCERPIVAQLYGKDPDLFYQAAHVVCELGFDGLDINMGCPSRNVASSGSGAGLIRTPDRAHAIMRAARQGILDWAAGQNLEQVGLKRARVDQVRAMKPHGHGTSLSVRQVIPLSVKTRLGYDSVVIEEWVAHLLQERPAVISIHGRTLAQMYRGSADWEAIERAVRVVRDSNARGATSTLVLGNGDLRSMPEIVNRVRTTGVNGVLVGRAALGAPWFFRQNDATRAACLDLTVQGSEESLWQAETSPTMSLSERFEIMVEHAQRFEALYGQDRFPRMRKHLGWYCKGFPHAAAMRADMVRASSSSDVARILSQYFAHVAGLPPPADSPLSELPSVSCV